MRTIKILLSCLFILGSLGLHGQRNNIEFNRDNDEEFISQLEYIIESADRNQRLKVEEKIDSFASLWMNDSIFVDERKGWVIQTLTEIQSLRLRPYPEHMLYLDNVMEVLFTREAESNFIHWHKSFQHLMDLRNQRRLLRYWEASLKLFQENIIYFSNTVTWQLENDQFNLLFEDEIPKVTFSDSDIVCYAQDDSTRVKNTRGEVHMLDEKLYGEGGVVNWERVLLHPDTVFAQLSNYTINLSVARYQADSVLFHNYHFFDAPIKGRLTERVLAEMTPEKARYPRFESYQRVHEIRDLFPGIDYQGGFTLQGGRVIGSGTSEGDAILDFYRSDSLFVTARGRSFSILPDRIVTQRAAVSMYLSGDSIYHPNINMRYLDAQREFSLLRDEKGFSKAPFMNTFHNIDMYCEAIYWPIDDGDIDLRMIRGINESGEAVFESRDFFSHVRYIRMQGMSDLHPLIRLRNFSREYNSRTFPINEYARYIRANPASVSNQLLSFSQNGFLSYNEDETVTLDDKLFHYIASYAGREDFDVIQIQSEAPVNGQININNFDLHFHGVERIPLSDQKNVVIHPTNNEIIMKKDRNMYFAGRVESGLFDFYGQEFFFDYEQFKIELNETDSMSFSVRSHEPDSRGNYDLVRVKTVLEGINGELLVDHPNNKSGQLPYPRYPIFNSNNESFVYYDRDFVQDGVYDRDNVHFKLIPFSIDSLDNATTDNIAFDGVFISTGIFPDFYDYLTVQPDYSLGFNTETPEEGYTVYDGKALYKGPIDMSYEGLRADGKLEYLSATAITNTMIMFPDSARANVNTFTLEAQAAPVEYPDVKARQVNMLYQPHQENMELTYSNQPFEIFAGQTHLEGTIALTPEGLTGDGSLELFNSQMISENFDFKNKDFTTNSVQLNIPDPEGEENLLVADGYASYTHIEEGNSELSIIDKSSMLDFAGNRFHGYGYDIDWDMRDGRFSMENVLQDELAQLGPMNPEDWIDYDFGGHELISSHPSQDSLKFYAGQLDYNLYENIIHASDVKLIEVADAAIFPANGDVKILERAEFEPLTNAVILANTTDRLHRFYDADINISTRWSYSGSGNYDYADYTGDIQTIFFETIEVDRAYRTTIANTEISQEQDFTISPEFAYQGDIHLKAENPNFLYDGAARIFVDCPYYQPNWVRFESELKKDSIFIPLAEDLRNSAYGRIETSIMLAGDSVHVYPAVLDRQKHYSDIPILEAEGYLTWNRDLRQYQFSTMEKFHDTSVPDNIITINPNTCIMGGYGDIVFSEDLGQFKKVAYGGLTYDLTDNEMEFDVVMGVDFFFLNNALGLIEDTIRTSENTSPVNLNRFKYASFLEKATDKERAAELMAEYRADTNFRRFPGELNHTFFFADLKMRWDQQARSFYTTEPLGLGNMERFPLNQYIEGYLEINKHRGGDVFNMILAPDGITGDGIGRRWFFFNYTNNIMQTISDINDYNQLIRDVPTRRRRMDVDRGEEPFTYIISSERRPFDFVRHMRILNSE